MVASYEIQFRPLYPLQTQTSRKPFDSREHQGCRLAINSRRAKITSNAVSLAGSGWILGFALFCVQNRRQVILMRGCFTNLPKRGRRCVRAIPHQFSLNHASGNKNP
jgi:hypothetical protein